MTGLRLSIGGIQVIFGVDAWYTTIMYALEEGLTMSPNAPDPNTYTPMHAAASYGHIHVLEYLISRGGDVNVIDSDGDTPIYTVENIDTAQYLVDKGATIDRVNEEGISV
ncbi:ankyrin repeat protein [Lentinula edodes]|uniref:Ankyrin repeat protein n=1 Tax=Lentinula edodes TaxID=5353 RepID=A0A1Q3ES35_LENED|nr:ankyrin repeat protein [Lentinula edodes]